jgi:(p)ppGpp synthase/HD superfamily hydrolase
MNQDYNELYDCALRIAIRAHEGQKDKSRREYVMHPIRVAERCKDPRAKIVALLHDTIEDTDVTADYLRCEGFPEEIINAVLSVTKQEGEDYEHFVHRAAKNVIGREVKIADLEDNMDIRRLIEIKDEDVARLRKYLRAWQYLIKLG